MISFLGGQLLEALEGRVVEAPKQQNPAGEASNNDLH